MTKPQILNAPAEHNRFFGRTEERATICGRLSQPDCRLLTLVGVGGIGKTRLALAAAADFPLSEETQPVFVPLQAISAVEYIPDAIAVALGRELSGSDAPDVQLLNLLADRKLLLILDNFEHLLDGAELLSRLLAAAPNVRLLVTSRQPLELLEEWLFPVSGLQTDRAGDAAFELFVHSARRVRPNFDPESERVAIMEICRLVDGSPLALELAAAWTRTLTCVDIVTEIQHNLDFLSTALRNVPERHRSMQTVFEQTWAQLTEKEQAVFARLSIFRGGFQREAATAVAKATLPILSSLIVKSLLRWQSEEAEDPTSGRYQIHELLRQYAAAKLNADDMAGAVRQHTHYYTQFLAGRLNDLLSSRQHTALAEIQAELDNVRLAWQHLVSSKDVAGLQQAVMPLLSFYWHQSRFLEGHNVFRQALTALEGLPPTQQRDAVLAMVQSNLAIFLMMLGKLDESNQLAWASQQFYETHQLPPPLGLDTDPRLTLANNARLLGDFETAVTLAQAALAYNQGHNHLRNTQEAYRMLAEAQMGQGALEEAWRNAEHSFALAQERDDLGGVAYAHETLGDIAFAQLRDEAAAQYHYQASYEIWERLGHIIGRADMLQRLGDLALRRRDYVEARQYFEQCLPLFEGKHVSGGVLGTLVRLGQTAVYQADYPIAQEQFLHAIPIALAHPGQHGEQITRLFRSAARLLLENGKIRQATSLLAALNEEPQPLLDNCRKLLDREVYETAVAHGQANPITDHLSSLQTLLAAPLASPPPASAPKQANQPLIEPLTAREQEVLELLAHGLTNQQIADRLIIATGTVKHYTSQIYGKLGVNGRTAAVLHAQEIGLLD